MSDCLFLICKKVGMTTVFDDRGVCLPVTVLHVPDNYIVGLRHKEKCGYNSIIVGSKGLGKHKNLAKPQKVEMEKSIGSEPAKNISLIKEFRIKGDLSLSMGTLSDKKVNHSEILSSIDNEYSFDATSISKGKGFQGPMKRHNFSGLRASHGVSVSHRSHGSTGNRKTPSKVFKGKRMAGRMGCEQITVQNLKFFNFDQELNLIAIHGCVPGHNNCVVYLKTSKKKVNHESISTFNGLMLNS
jgi:large subunit ribosomal protein L3